MPSTRRLLLIAAFSLAGATSSAQTASSSQEPAPVATPLTTKSVSFSEGKGIVLQGTPRCDASGNLYYVPVPPVDPRDLRAFRKNPRSKPRYTRKPSEIVRVSPNGKKTIFEPSRMPEASGASAFRVNGIAVDQSGTLHALVWVKRDDRESQYLVSFNGDGRVGSHVEIPQDEILASSIEFFGSGAVLVSGYRPHVGPRLAIMSPRGDSFLDVSPLPGASGPPRIEHRVRGGDGRIYFLTPGKESISFMEESGETKLAFEVSVSPEHGVVGLKSAGARLAVTYWPGPDEQAFFWMAVYSPILGERLALYGPASNSPVCYSSEDGHDVFRALMGTKLVTSFPQ